VIIRGEKWGQVFIREFRRDVGIGDIIYHF
jgi:hypothetical protein